MDDQNSISDLSSRTYPTTTSYNNNSKICNSCNLDLPLNKYIARRSICSNCYNEQRRHERSEKAKKIAAVVSKPISEFVKLCTDDDDNEYFDSISIFLKNLETIPDSEKDITIFLFLLDNILESRVKDLSSWIHIGKVFYNICIGNEIGLKYWIDYSNKYNMDISNCNLLYKSFSTKIPITIKTIFYFLKLDNILFFNIFRKIYISQSIFNCECLTHDVIGLALYNLLFLDYFYCGKTNTWYHYKNNILEKDIKNNYFKQSVTDKFIPAFTLIIDHIRNTNEMEEKEKNTHIFNYQRVIKKMQSNDFLSQCIVIAAKYFRTENLNLYLNSNNCLISVNNCVIETIQELNITIPRHSIQEDYITYKSNAKYDKNMSEDDPNMQILLKWLHQLFPDEDLYEYVIKLCSAFLVGKNVIKKFIIFSGKSNGGKSSFCKLLEKTFGMYYTTVSSSFLDKNINSNSSGPSPELMKLKNMHITVVPEADNSSTLSTNKIKKFTGGDTFTARNCYSDGEILFLTTFFILCCNTIPSLDEIDDAITNRLQIVPFISVYKEGVEDDYINRIFKRNNNFDTDILPNLITPFLSLLVKYYPKFSSEGLGNVKIIDDYTKAYFMKTDLYLIYTSEILETADSNEFVSVSDIFPIFSSWFITNYPSVKKPNKQFFITEMNRVLGENNRNKWYGYKLIEQ